MTAPRSASAARARTAGRGGSAALGLGFSLARGVSLALGISLAAPPAPAPAVPASAAAAPVSQAPDAQAHAALTPAPSARGSPGPADTLVVCAPGYPGSTETAQPTMDAFARIAAEASGWRTSSLSAVYFETAEGGSRRLAAKDAGLALLSLPFFLQHESDLDLAARLQVVQQTGALETWSLAARRGRISSAAALAGWEIAGAAGYAPEFVRGAVLGSWGSVPTSARVTFTANVLSALRRAAAGEDVAVLLDGPQAGAMPSLPFASDLEIVARSPAMPGTLLCTVGRRLPAKRADEIVRGLERLHTRPEWADVLKTMRMTRFEPVDAGALARARSAAEAQAPAPRPPRP